MIGGVHMNVETAGGVHLASGITDGPDGLLQFLMDGYHLFPPKIAGTKGLRCPPVPV